MPLGYARSMALISTHENKKANYLCLIIQRALSGEFCGYHVLVNLLADLKVADAIRSFPSLKCLDFSLS